MLILTRRIGEVLKVGDQVDIVLADVRGDQVRIGIKAPCHIPVHRQEIYERLQATDADACTGQVEVDAFKAKD